jgi:hypothetical protein
MSEEDMQVLAKAVGLVISPAHAAGVTRNLEILFGQAALLAEASVDQHVEPAPVFRP